jgi:hypothetical protein
MEEYKNFIENIEVSNFGNVRRKLENGDFKEIKGSILNRGYKYFQLQKDGKRTNYLVHHVVAKLFLCERPENMVIDHIDRNSLNNNVNNLRYCSQSENMRNTDRYKSHISITDQKERHYLVCKEYRNNHSELLEKKKVYYQKNKDKLIQKYKGEKYEIKCDECNNIRSVSRGSYNRIKKNLGINICKRCSALKNLFSTMK